MNGGYLDRDSLMWLPSACAARACVKDSASSSAALARSPRFVKRYAYVVPWVSGFRSWDAVNPGVLRDKRSMCVSASGAPERDLTGDPARTYFAAAMAASVFGAESRRKARLPEAARRG
jgi:hypothetical protein